MKKTDASELRKTMEIVKALRDARVLFVPIPVMDDEDHAELVDLLKKRVEIINAAVEAKKNAIKEDSVVYIDEWKGGKNGGNFGKK